MRVMSGRRLLPLLVAAVANDSRYHTITNLIEYLIFDDTSPTSRFNCSPERNANVRGKVSPVTGETGHASWPAVPENSGTMSITSNAVPSDGSVANMSATYNVLSWSPVLIGFMFSTSMYGSTLAQSIYYLYWFPNDHKGIRLLVFCIAFGDTIHLVGSTHLFWKFFVTCHGDDPFNCSDVLPWGGLTMTCLNTILSSIVQCFYCHRIWIISGKNKVLTFIVSLSALSGLVSGTWYNVDVARVGTIQYLFQCPLILPIAVTNTVCDILITCTILKYMWRSSLKRNRRSIIQDLAVVCVNMGALTCLTSFITGLMFLAQGDGYWVASVGMVISQSYANSMMAVLNARKVIRDREPGSIELITMTP